MPRIRQNAVQYRKEDFARYIRSRLKLLGLQQRDLAEQLAVSEGTVSVMLKDPWKIPLERLCEIISYLDLEPASVLRFLGYSTKKIKEIDDDE